MSTLDPNLQNLDRAEGREELRRRGVRLSGLIGDHLAATGDLDGRYHVLVAGGDERGGDGRTAADPHPFLAEPSGIVRVIAAAQSVARSPSSAENDDACSLTRHHQ